MIDIVYKYGSIDMGVLKLQIVIRLTLGLVSTYPVL